MQKTLLQPHVTQPQTPPPTSSTEILWLPPCGAWIVRWCGHSHGGLHHREDDAIAHAAMLDLYPPEERAAWLAEHELDCRELNEWLCRLGA